MSLYPVLPPQLATQALKGKISSWILLSFISLYLVVLSPRYSFVILKSVISHIHKIFSFDRVVAKIAKIEADAGINLPASDDDISKVNVMET